MTLTLKIPTSVGGSRASILVKRGHKTLGQLCNKPEVKGDKLIAGRVILVARDHELIKRVCGPEEVLFFTNDFGYSCMEVSYGDDYATYRLFEDQLVFSDGPPHPDDLQLALRIARTDGIAEPQVP